MAQAPLTRSVKPIWRCKQCTFWAHWKPRADRHKKKAGHDVYLVQGIRPKLGFMGNSYSY